MPPSVNPGRAEGRGRGDTTGIDPQPDCAERGWTAGATHGLVPPAHGSPQRGPERKADATTEMLWGPSGRFPPLLREGSPGEGGENSHPLPSLFTTRRRVLWPPLLLGGVTVKRPDVVQPATTGKLFVPRALTRDGDTRPGRVLRIVTSLLQCCFQTVSWSGNGGTRGACPAPRPIAEYRPTTRRNQQ